MTYETTTINIPPLQEGNLQDLIHLELAESMPLDQFGDITVVVKSTSARTVILSGKKSTGEVLVTGQRIRVPLSAASTTGKAGDFEYEMDIKNLENQPILTIKGKGTIQAQINTL
jgi:hypothetical protein